MTLRRILLPCAKRFAAGAAITVASGGGLLVATSPAAHASVREAPTAVSQSIKFPGATAIEYSAKYPDVKWQGSIDRVVWEGSVKYPGATAIEYSVKLPHITF